MSDLTDAPWSWQAAREELRELVGQITPEQALAVLHRLIEEPNEQHIAPMLSGLIRGYAERNRNDAGKCSVCGVLLQQKERGRRRKYCEACAQSLGHRSANLSARKTGAEKATE